MVNNIEKKELNSNIWNKYSYHFLFVLTIIVAALIRSLSQ